MQLHSCHNCSPVHRHLEWTRVERAPYMARVPTITLCPQAGNRGSERRHQQGEERVKKSELWPQPRKRPTPGIRGGPPAWQKGGPPRAGGGPALVQSTSLRDPPHIKTHGSTERFTPQGSFPAYAGIPQASGGSPPPYGTVSPFPQRTAHQIAKPAPRPGAGAASGFSRAKGVRPLLTHLTQRRQSQMDSAERPRSRKTDDKQLLGLLTNNDEQVS
jgi:hypothetical protein